MNYLQLQEEVQRNVIDLPTAVQNGVPSFINRAMKTLQSRHNFKVMEAEVDHTTTVATRTLNATMPTRFKEWRLEPFVLSEDGVWYEISFENITAIRRYYGEEDEGVPKFLHEAEPSTEAFVNAIHVYPLPDGNSDYDNGEYRISIPYYAYVTPLAASGDSNWFTTNAEEWLIFQATAEAFFTDWDENRGAIWTQRAASKMDEVKMQDKRYRLSGVREIIPHWQGARKPFVRR